MAISPLTASRFRGADSLKEAAQGVLFVGVQGTDGGCGYALGGGAGTVQFSGAGLGEVEQGDPAIGGMRAPGDQAARLQAVDHVGDRPGRYVQGLADLAHGAVAIAQGLQELQARQR